MKAFLALTAFTALAACGSGTPAPAPSPSVEVSVVRPQRGSLPATVLAYGSVAPAMNGTQTISEAQPGQIERLMVTPGMAVRAGQPLAAFMLAPSARSSYQQAVQAVATAGTQRDTAAQLLGQKLGTTDQLAQANQALSDAQAALAVLRADGAGRAAHTITAPFSGFVTAITATQGDRLQANAPILTIARGGEVVVTAGIDPADRSGVKAGQAASIQRLSGGGAIRGKVLRVASALNAATRLVDADIAFPSGALLPGEAMQVAIETGQVSGWLVPHKAVVTASGPDHVFQVAGKKAKSVPVKVALSSDNGDIVEGQIDPSKPLIVAGAYQVSDGDLVRRSR